MISQLSRSSFVSPTHQPRTLSVSHHATSVMPGPDASAQRFAQSRQVAPRGLAAPAARGVAVRAQNTDHSAQQGPMPSRTAQERNTWPQGPEGKTATLMGAGMRHGKKLPFYFQKDIAKHYAGLDPLLAEYDAQALDLPAYVKREFHVWGGNENLPAAFNGETVMTFFADVNAAKKPNPKKKGASRLDVVNAACSAFLPTLGCKADDVTSVVDLGCGTGRPTRLLANRFKHAHVVGVDATSEALAVARYRTGLKNELEAEEVVDDRVSFVRALAEATPFADNSQDVVYMSYVAHELPRDARNNILKEAFRIVRPGGVVAVVDHIQAGSKEYFLFNKLQKCHHIGDAAEAFFSFQAPEPFLREYHLELLGDSFAKHGYEPAQVVKVSKGQHVVFARKPV